MDRPGDQFSPVSTDIAPTRFCLDCRYVLNALPEDRCPECGRPFDPQVPSTYATSPRRFDARPLLPIVPVLLLLGQWLLYPGCSPHPLEYVLLLATALLLVVGPRGVRLAAVLSLALAPAVLSFGRGAAGYVLGTAKLHPATEMSEIELVDRASRLPRRARSQCAVANANDRDVVYDCTLKMLSALFGPMRGAYTGEYPTLDECHAALASGVTLRCRDVSADRIRGLPGGAIVAGQSIGYFALYASGHSQCLLSNNSAANAPHCDHGLPPRAVRIGRQCVVLQVPRVLASGNGELLFLIDAKWGGVIACYWTGGGGRPRYVHRCTPRSRVGPC
jgi:hypothetical protein